MRFIGQTATESPHAGGANPSMRPAGTSCPLSPLFRECGKKLRLSLAGIIL